MQETRFYPVEGHEGFSYGVIPHKREETVSKELHFAIPDKATHDEIEAAFHKVKEETGWTVDRVHIPNEFLSGKTQAELISFNDFLNQLKTGQSPR